ncbi:MAG: TonB-dependent receptor [Verrucomicrobia bacterium]|nr:TonB-dependent receptor [Verrucomicrobiota bacterium]
MHSPFLAHWPRLLSCGVLLAFGSALSAQSPATGRIAGRIFNPATQEYVRNAEISLEGTALSTFSEDAGAYLLSGVPAGEVTLIVTYTGYDRATARVRVAPGETATRDFELVGSTYQSGVAKPGESVVRLDKFVVSTEREGNAKAIMEQRAALNMKNVVASDNFGDVTGGNIGEFMKYLPGVVIDYNNADARAVRIGGLDPKYASVSIDGMRMASAASALFGATTRQFEFEQASITSVETIELNKTLTASMDADAPAGSMNLRSRNAFDRKGREITATATVSANPYDLTWRRTPGPGDGVHRKIRPGAVFTYAESFQQRFGVQVSLSANQLYNEQSGLTHTFDNTIAARGPVINTLVFRDNPKITTRAASGLTLDYKFTPHLIVSWKMSGSHFRDEINARTITFRAATAQIDPSSSLTSLLALPTANTTTRMESAIGHSDKWNDTVVYTPKIEYRRNDLLITASGGYSRSTTHYEDRRSGYWANTANWITRMSWSARRTSSTSTDWQLARVSGPAWNDIANYNRADANANNISTAERTGRSQVWSGYLDAKQTVNLGLPVTIGAGLKSRLTAYDLWKTGSLTWTYVGPARNQLDPSTVMITHANPGVFDAKQGDNLPTLGIPIPNATAMYELYQAHPEYFTENTVGNFTTLYTSPRAAKEQIDAGYVEFNTRWNRLRLNLGVRQERTRTVGRNFDLVPNALVRAAGYTAGTIPYVVYQYRGFERSNKYGGYDNTFYSGGAKYSLARNLVLQLSASQSIGRPDYNNLAGVITINDTNLTVRVPNPDLKPETSDKYFASVQYYIEPAGTLTVSGYELSVKNMGLGTEQISAAEAGYADDPEYSGYTFLRSSNAPGTRKIRGAELEYSQQLVFLPGFARGFSVFGSISRASPDTPVANLVPKAANGGLRFSNHLFNVQLRATWSSARLTSTSATLQQWDYERLMFDLSGGWKLNRTYELTLSGRNIGNAPIRGYVNNPGLLRINQLFGAVWTLGVRGRW